MKNKSIYEEGHLLAAAIRVLEHLNNAPPTLDQIAQLLKLPNEQIGLIGRRLKDAQIIAQVEGAFDERWTLRDHLKIEELPRVTSTSQLDNALEKFKSERQKLAEKVESIKEEQARKKRDLFAGIEKKLKQDLTKDNSH
jgi:hypothetical protein